MDTNIIKAIAFEVGIIAISALASFIIPGLGGIIVSGLIQFLGDLGIQINDGNTPSDPAWFITEFLMLFGPYFKEMTFAKTQSSLVRKLSMGVEKVEDFLTKVDESLMNSIEFLKKKSAYQFTSRSGYTPAIEEEVRQVEQQELAREKFGIEKTKITKKLNSFTPNTKNPDSWIAGVAFVEKARFGPRDIRGDLIITYYVNNDKRVGFRKVPITKIVLGRTSGGERKDSNQARYKKVSIDKDMNSVKIRKVVFKGARYYNDYLAFLKSHSWGGYYMRRWMVGVPGRKAGINSLILFGSIYRVWSKFRAISGDAKDLTTDTKALIKSKSKEVFSTTRFGSKYNKVTGAFSKANSIQNNPMIEARSFFKEKSNSKKESIRQKGIKK